MKVKKQKSVWGIALKAGTIQTTQVFGSRKDAEDAIAKISHLSNAFEAVELAPANSPELPDGWIKCSERMPADCQTVLCNNMLTELSGIPFIADYVGMFELHDGTRYEAGFYINRIPQTVTHWMVLPTPPTTEK
ncbi:TPA: DUF551 domain-containing protein [Serratia fonticola]|nr:DUF551 domain-containing protein [Serratia fonticola]